MRAIESHVALILGQALQTESREIAPVQERHVDNHVMRAVERFMDKDIPDGRLGASLPVLIVDNHEKKPKASFGFDVPILVAHQIMKAQRATAGDVALVYAPDSHSYIGYERLDHMTTILQEQFARELGARMMTPPSAMLQSVQRGFFKTLAAVNVKVPDYCCQNQPDSHPFWGPTNPGICAQDGNNYVKNHSGGSC